MSRVTGFRKEEIGKWARKHIALGSLVVSDGLSCFRAIGASGNVHTSLVTGGGPDSVTHPSFTWVNTILGNVKNALHGTYHAIYPKHLPRYLAESCYRFNRRFTLSEMLPRLAYVALRTSPLPYRLAKCAEAHW